MALYYFLTLKFSENLIYQILHFDFIFIKNKKQVEKRRKISYNVLQ